MTSPRGITIRAAMPAEADDLSALAMRAKSHWGYSAQTLESWRPELMVSPQAIRTRPTFVAMIGSRTAGFCSLRASSTSWELDNLWVEPELMHRGIGRALLRHAIETARLGGATEILIDSDPNAEAFYIACGAVRRGEMPAPTREEPDRVRPQLAVDCRPRA
jgi:ribosomal protein S18 acetylase RimI-like enzyme